MLHARGEGQDLRRGPLARAGWVERIQEKIERVVAA
jgi:hypothetical protein